MTITLDEETVREAKVLAAEEGTSVSALLAQQVRKLIAERARYRRARQDALRMLSEVEDRGGVAPWTREELYDRWQD